VLKVAGDVDFDGANGGRWSFGPDASLETLGSGGALQSFEVAGRNLGFVAAGFTNDNFYLPELVIGPDGRLVLRDQRDNGNQSAGVSEALYVDKLVFSDSLGLIYLNGVDLYYNQLVGSEAQIVPEPATLLYVALGLVALVYRARARAR